MLTWSVIFKIFAKKKKIERHLLFLTKCIFISFHFTEYLNKNKEIFLYDNLFSMHINIKNVKVKHFY